MSIDTLLDNTAFVAFSSLIGGILITVLAQHILNKRGVISFQVHHAKVGVSADDAVYGSVRVTWNAKEIGHLYLSTVEIQNESIKDFSDVTIRIFTNDTNLLTERTGISGTTRTIEQTTDYRRRTEVADDTAPSQQQIDLYSSQRDYIVPVFNRGQILKFEYLNAAKSEAQPTLWVDIVHPGAVCKFKSPVALLWGVPQPQAVLYGTFICIIIWALAIPYVDTKVSVSLLSFLLGWTALIPGALAIRLYRRIKEFITG